MDRRRSIAVSQFEPLARVSGVHLYSLQVGPAREELVPAARDWPLTDLADELTDLHETAAAMRNLDLVISCDSAPAHLAGALGVAAWVALAVVPDWRWMLGRDDSPWYPTLRLFRQSASGRWDDVFARMAGELARRAGS
jgi:hypothetical protein